MTAPLIFDLDGVLANSRRPIVDSVNAALVALGHGARSEEAVARTIGPPSEIGFAGLLDAEPESEVVAAAIAEYRRRYVDAVSETPSYPGVPEVVRELAAAGPLGVATSKPRRYALPTLEAIGLDGVFAVVAGPEPGGPADKGSMLAEALAALGGDAAAMIGDTHFDMAAAKARGLHAIGVTWGFGSPDELRDAGADELVGRPAELLAAATRARLFRSVDDHTPRRLTGLPPDGG